MDILEAFRTALAVACMSVVALPLIDLAVLGALRLCSPWLRRRERAVVERLVEEHLRILAWKLACDPLGLGLSREGHMGCFVERVVAPSLRLRPDAGTRARLTRLVSEATADRLHRLGDGAASGMARTTGAG